MLDGTVAKHPLSVHVFATSRCNLNCTHCFIDTSSDSTSKYDLPADILLRALSEIEDVTPHAEFEIEGGEILLHPQFKTIINGLREEILPRVTMTTNGSIPFPFDEIRMTGQFGPFRLRISAEGHTEKIHGLIRANRLIDVLHCIEHGVRANAKVVIRTTLHSGNIQYMKEMIATFAATGANELQFLEFQTVGRGSLPENRWLVPDDKSFESAVQKFATDTIPDGINRMSLNLSKRRIVLLERLSPILEQKGLSIVFCRIPSITLNWNGSLGLCPWRPFKTILSDQWPNDFTSYISHMLHQDILYHDCDFCSAASIIRRCNGQ